MLHTRRDQENLSHIHSTTAASKPLNQGARGLEAKTPGQQLPKTPFRTGRGNENAIGFGFGPQTGLKPSKAKNDIFVTPAATQTRAPLGIKTTNVKARNWQTPAGEKTRQPTRSATKQTSPRLRRSKVRIHQAETEATPEDDAEPEIEYMPPRSIPLPDHPEHEDSDDERIKLDAERIFQELCKENIPPLTTGGNLERSSLRDEARRREDEELLNTSIRQTMLWENSNEQERRSLLAPTSQPPKPSSSALKPRSTIPSKSTVSASSKPITMDSPSFAKPTAAALARIQGPERLTDAGLHKTRAAPVAATATSRSTLGYSRGRAVSANARRFKSGPSEAHRAPVYKKATRPVSALPDDPDGLIANFKRASLGETQQAGERSLIDQLDEDLLYGDFELERIGDDE